MEFLAYSDIHHDDYKNGITLEDTIAIEDKITQYAVDLGIKFVLFAGDWFRATNPTQLVIKEAEASWVRRSKVGVTTIVVPGNHDRFTKSENSKHAFYSMRVFERDLENIWVKDHICVWTLMGVEFISIPAGWQNRPLPKRITNDPLVVVLHAMIHGSKLASGINATGMDPQIIKDLNPILVLAGDNHTPQNLSMFMHPSRYLGAPIQHTWGDKDQDRGFWHVMINNGVNVKCIYCDTHTPKFVRANVFADNEVSFICSITDLLNKKLNGCPGIIDITLTGNNVGLINRQVIEDSIKSNFNIRRLKLNINHQIIRPELVAGLSQLKSPEDKWSAYVTSDNAVNTKEMNIPMLLEMGKWALQEARKI